MEKTNEDKIKELLNICNLAGKKICIQHLISNDEIGHQCVIIVMDLHNNNDISDVLHRINRERTVRTQNRIVSSLYNTKDDKLKNQLIDDLNTLDMCNIVVEEEFQAKCLKNNIENKCRCFILSLRPDFKIELRRMDTNENIDIKDINDLFNVLNDEKYDFY